MSRKAELQFGKQWTYICWECSQLKLRKIISSLSINHHTFIINVGSAASLSWEQISSSEHNSLKFRIKVGLARHLKVRSHIMRVNARSNVVFLAMLDITICLGVQNVLVHASGCHQPADLLEFMPWTCKFWGRLPQNLDIWDSIFFFEPIRPI